MIRLLLRRVPWYAWPAILSLPGRSLIALYYIIRGRKR